VRLPVPVAVLLLGAAGASTVDPPAAGGRGPAAAEGVGSAASAAPAAPHTVEIRDFAFVPARLDVAPGDTVVWVNRDAAPHTATDSLGGWDSGELKTEVSWTWVAPAPGRFPYLCAYHPSMRGEVHVRDAAPAASRDPTPAASRGAAPAASPGEAPPVDADSLAGGSHA